MAQEILLHGLAFQDFPNFVLYIQIWVEIKMGSW